MCCYNSARINYCNVAIVNAMLIQSVTCSWNCKDGSNSVCVAIKLCKDGSNSVRVAIVNSARMEVTVYVLL